MQQGRFSEIYQHNVADMEYNTQKYVFLSV